MSNINDTYFEGHYKDIWRSIIPAELTAKEVDFMMQYFNLGKGSKVLDIMCGYGRHSIQLAQKGIIVTALDNLEDYVEEVRQVAETEGLLINAVKTNLINYTSDDEFDLVICMGNSLNFFNAADTKHILSNIASLLKSNGYLLINSWSLAEIAIKNFTPRSWSEIGELKILSDCKYLFQPTRLETDTLILSPDGGKEEKKAIDYIYSVAEMEAMLSTSGFKLEEIYSIPGRKKFALGDPRAYIIAKKI